MPGLEIQSGSSARIFEDAPSRLGAAPDSAAGRSQAKIITLHALSYQGVPLAPGSDVVSIATATGEVTTIRERNIPQSVDGATPEVDGRGSDPRRLGRTPHPGGTGGGDGALGRSRGLRRSRRARPPRLAGARRSRVPDRTMGARNLGRGHRRAHRPGRPRGDLPHPQRPGDGHGLDGIALRRARRRARSTGPMSTYRQRRRHGR